MLRKTIIGLAAAVLLLTGCEPAFAADVTSDDTSMTITGTDSDETVYVQIGDGADTLRLDPGQTHTFEPASHTVSEGQVFWAVWVDDTLEANGSWVYPPVEPGAADPVVADEGLRDGAVNQTASLAPDWFDDIATSVHRLDIVWLSQQGITKGCTQSSFCPKDNTTRGQMAAFIRRAAYPLITSLRPAFDDIVGTVFVHDINSLAHRGVVDGITEHQFGPDLDIKRGDVIRWLCNTQRFPTVVGAESPFTDVPTTHPDYQCVYTLYAAGVLYGYDDGTAGLGDKQTREQMASFLRRAFG